MRFADIREHLENGWGDDLTDKERWMLVKAAMIRTLTALAAQEAIREAVPVRCDKCGGTVPLGGNQVRISDCSCPPAVPVREPGPTLAEQIAHMRKVVVDYDKAYHGKTYSPARDIDVAVLRSLERLAREADDGR